MYKNKKIRALGLCSGGLDSILSALILKKQGIDVEWITFKTPFFSPDSAIRASKQNNIPLIIKDITSIYMEMLKAPPAGYGKNMNPCLDCHSLMFNQAGLIMRKKGYDFLFSGEVVGQRPMSQNKNSMNYVEKHSGFKGEILRPLSAKILPETAMEKEGLVDRQQLGNISGRSRKLQIEMAKEFGVTEYPPPAGGCLLTDKNFSIRLRDLMFIQKSYCERDLYLLNYGRHLRFDEQIKIIVGKSENDNNHIETLYIPESDILIRHAFLAGPLVLIPYGLIMIQDQSIAQKSKKNSECYEKTLKNTNQEKPNQEWLNQDSSLSVMEIIIRAGSICASYTKAKDREETQILVKLGLKQEQITVCAFEPKIFNAFMIT